MMQAKLHYVSTNLQAIKVPLHYAIKLKLIIDTEIFFFNYNKNVLIYILFYHSYKKHHVEYAVPYEETTHEQKVPQVKIYICNAL